MSCFKVVVHNDVGNTQYKDATANKDRKYDKGIFNGNVVSRANEIQLEAF